MLRLSWDLITGVSACRSLLVLHVRPQSAVWYSSVLSSPHTSDVSVEVLEPGGARSPEEAPQSRPPSQHPGDLLQSDQGGGLLPGSQVSLSPPPPPPHWFIVFRVFGSGFLSHQGSIAELAGDSNHGNMQDIIPATERDRMEFFQQIKVSMDMKTNLPEPYQPLDGGEGQNDLKEGLPVGLSDSQVVRQRFCLFLFIFSNLGESWGQIQHGLQIRNSLTKLVNWRF